MSKPRNLSPEPSDKQIFIGFPPPLLGAEPVRLPVLGCGAGLLAVNLPGGLAADADPLNPQGVPLLAHALREQLAAGKPELVRLGVRVVQSIFNLEPQMSGVALYAVNRDAVDTWRNAYGSGLLRLRFLLICERAPDLSDVIDCDLPIARHRDGGQMLVSHKSGKKTATQFRRLKLARAPKGKPNPLFDKELWEAMVTYLRPHQIRLHAHEVGLRVCGENLYAQVPSFYLSELKGLRRRLPEEEPLWTGPMVHLSAIEPVDATALSSLGIGGVPQSKDITAQGRQIAVPDYHFTGHEAGQVPADALADAPESLQWPLFAPLPRPLGLASRLLFGDVANAGCNPLSKSA